MISLLPFHLFPLHEWFGMSLIPYVIYSAVTHSRVGLWARETMESWTGCQADGWSHQRASTERFELGSLVTFSIRKNWHVFSFNIEVFSCVPGLLEKRNFPRKKNTVFNVSSPWHIRFKMSSENDQKITGRLFLLGQGTRKKQENCLIAVWVTWPYRFHNRE